MRIGIDAHFAEKDGSGNCTYTQGILKSLSRIDTVNEYFLYITDRDHAFYKKLSGKRNFHIRHVFPSNPLIRIPVSIAAASYKDRIDVLYAQYNAPPLHSGKLVLMVHDLAFLHFPGYFSAIERIRLKSLVPWTARRSAAVITVSEHSRSDLAVSCGISPDKIKVVHNGIDDGFLSPVTDRAAVQGVLDSYGIDFKYILYVGRLNARKNIERLIQAYALFRKRKPCGIKLVLAGKKDYLFENIMSALAASGFEKDIVLLDYVPEKDISCLFSAAEMFVYPSLFEGFGLPPLEAMACGCPVVASGTTSIPEVVGDAAVLVDPLSAEDICRGMMEVASSPSLRRELAGKGLEQARKFTWDRAAAEMVRIYGEVNGGGKKS